MPFARYERTIVDDQGNVITNASVEVRLEAAGAPIATQIYSDYEGASALTNPFTVTDGTVAFHAVGGMYRIRIYNSSGYDKTFRYVPIGTAQGADVDAYAQAGFTWAPESSASAPPSSGCIRFNNADAALATIMYVHATTLSGAAVKSWLTGMASGAKTYKNRILFATSNSEEASWEVGTVTDNTTYVSIALSNYVGPTSIAIGDSGFLTLARSISGADGGVTSVNGATGAISAPVLAGSSVGMPSGTASLDPDADDGASLGTALLKWSDIYLAAGAVINFNNGDVTITHSTDALAFAGAANGYSFDKLLIPNGSIKYDRVAVFTPADNMPPAANYATLDTRNGHSVLDFDTTTQEGAVFGGVMPNHYAGGSIRVTIWSSLTSAITGTLGWLVAFETLNGLDIDADSFAADQTATAATVPGTSGQPMTHQVTCTQAQADSIAAGDAFRLRIRRDVANDTAAGDAELLRVLVEIV